MEESNQRVTKAPVRRTRKQIIKLLRDYQTKEGMTIVEYCKLHDINKSNFYNWQKRYGTRDSGHGKPKGFVEVELSPASIQPAINVPSLFAEVNGIRLYQVVSADYLKTLLS